MHARKALCACAVAVALASAGIATALARGGDEQAVATQRPAPAVAYESGPISVQGDANLDDDRLPNQTADDWVTYADHVVTATVVGERSLALVKNPGGTSWRDREVTLEVEATHWTSARPREALPPRFVLETWGFRYTKQDPDVPIRMAGEGRSRLEVGHTYVIALFRKAARCSA